MIRNYIVCIKSGIHVSYQQRLLAFCFLLPFYSQSQELSVKAYGIFNTSTASALSDQGMNLDVYHSSIHFVGGEYAHRLSDKWSMYMCVGKGNISVYGKAGPLQWPSEFVEGAYVDDESWPNYRSAIEESANIVLSIGSRRYFDLGKKSIVPFVSLQGDVLFNYRQDLRDNYSNDELGFSSKRGLQPQFRGAVRVRIDKHKDVSAAILALLGVELRIGNLLRLRGGWAVRADLLDYARNVDYLRTFARGVTLQAGINLPSARRTFFPKKDKEVEE